MSDQLFGVFGASGFGREVMPLARAYIIESFGVQHLDRLVFIDDNSDLVEVNGSKVLSYDSFVSTPASERIVTIAIANSHVREKLARQMEQDNIRTWHLQATNTVVMDGVEFGAGAVLCPFVTVTSNAHIGQHFHANIYSYVAHDCKIGDYVTFAPRVCCNGNVHIEDHAYIGTGAVLRQGSPDKPLHIGRGAIIGMGAVVTKDVPANTTVVGNPAKPLVR